MSATTIEIPLQLSFENRPLTSTAVVPTTEARGLAGACGINLLTDEGFLCARPPLVQVATGLPAQANLYSPGPSELYAIASVGGAVSYSNVPGAFTTLTGSVSSTTGTWAASPLSQNVAYVAGPNQGWYRSGANFVAIADANFITLNLLPFVANLDGTYYVMTVDGSIYGSNLNDASVWSALNRINAWQDSSQGIALIKHRSYIVALKQTSMQVFYDAGNPVGSPLLPLLAAQQPVGCADVQSSIRSSVVEIRGDHFWIARSPDSSVFVAQMSNLQITPVSTPAVNRWLEWLLRLGTSLQGSKIACWGKLYYAISTPSVLGTPASTLIYDIADKTWSFWEGSFLYRLSSGTYSIGFGDSQRPDIYYTDGSHVFKFLTLPYINTVPVAQNVVWADDSPLPRSGIQAQFTSTIVDGGTQREKTAMRLEIFSDNSNAGSLELQWSDDDYKSWSVPVTIDLTQPRAFVDDLGTFRRRAFRFRHTSQCPLRIQRMALTVLLGSS